MTIIREILGTYEGSGKWHDSAGTSMGYTSRQINRLTSTGFEVEFKHHFDDGSLTDARLLMTWLTPAIFRVDMGNNPVGHGYCLGDCCNFHIKAGEAFVEVSYRPQDSGLLVHGSSTKNADGNYIAWHENLQKKI